LESLPVFPLPATVLFPGVVIPLHIFEPRYRAMVRDALDTDDLIALAMVQPGLEEEDTPPLCDVACAGTIIHSEQLPDGGFNILLQGSFRVRLVAELPRERLYRRFSAEVIPAPTEHDEKAARQELVELESCVVSLVHSVAERDAELVEVVRSTTDPIKLADILAATVVRDASVQQDLLATSNLKSRLSKLVAAMVDVLVEVGEPSSARPN
jgi:Lon protease-like protein